MSRTALLALAALALLPLGAAPLAAQRVVSTIDAGGVWVRYADSIAEHGPTLSPSVRAEWDRATLDASATYAQLTGGWTTNGTATGSVYAPALGPVTGELALTAGGSANRDGTHTGQALGILRAHLIGSTRGLWIGGGAGRTWDGSVWRTEVLGEGGVWAGTGPFTAVATVRPTLLGDTIRYTDVEGAGRLALGRLELGASAGFRSGRNLPAYGGASTSWGSVSATAWLTSWAGVVVSTGAYPVDLTQGFPGGRYTFLALRLGRHAAQSPEPAPGIVPNALEAELVATARAGVQRFRVTGGGGGGKRVLTVLAPAARRVEVAGDFTAWSPVQLARAGRGWWTAALPIARGSHEMNIRVDRGAWLVPPGLTPVANEFGGAVGILVIQ